MRACALAVAAAGLMVSASAFAGPQGLDASIGPALDKAAAGAGVVRYSLSNNSKVDVLVLAWETPLRGVEADLFEVARDGKLVRYVGREYKRGTPQPEDYIELKAGQTLSMDVDLSAHYEMRDAGNYRVQFVGHFHDTFAVRPAKQGTDEKLLPVEVADLRSAMFNIWVDGVSVPVQQEPTGVLNFAKAGSTGFVGCSNSQTSGAQSGHTAAQNYAANANSYLAAGLRGTRYTTWFGSYSSSIYSTLTSNFSKIAGALNNQYVEYHCDCTSSAFAYVYPTQPYKIHLCNAFWQANTTGTDSKGGTIIHETSHFDVVANTDDIAYGQAACKKLSKRSSRAIKNADSHEYFAENTPAGT